MKRIFCVFCALLLLAGCGKKASGAISMADLCSSDTLSAADIQSALETATGMPWSEYKEKISATLESGEDPDVPLTLDGEPVYYVISQPEGGDIRAITLVLLSDSQDAEAWLQYSATLSDILSAHCTDGPSYTTFYFNGGKVTLEVGPVDPASDSLSDRDATILGSLGNRVEEIRITFGD
jgi:hypothetical protein